MAQKNMHFQYGDRELILTPTPLLSTTVDVIVSPANHHLSDIAGLAQQIVDAAGQDLVTQRQQLIREYGEIHSGMAVYTSAGDLPYQAVLHAVGPSHDENARVELEQVISRCLLICETNGWSSIAFPLLSDDSRDESIDLQARAYFRSICSFWDARHSCEVIRILIAVPEHAFQRFFDAFRDDAINDDLQMTEENTTLEPEESVGYVEINEEDIQIESDDEINEWFK
jgi:O-acetyl-ADP-ribose deacetylase (regulator of RNase III)